MNQRQHIRNLWQRCYLAKDYVGAIMVSPSSFLDSHRWLIALLSFLQALSTLAEVDHVTPEDLEKLLEMLDYADVPQGVGLDGSMLLFQQHMQTMNGHIRGIVLKAFIQFLFGQGDVKSAKNILRKFRTHTSIDFQAHLLVCDTLLSCYQLQREAEILMDVPGLQDLAFTTFPSMGEILHDPLLFYFPVKLLYHFSKGHLDSTLSTQTSSSSSSAAAASTSAKRSDVEKRKVQVLSLLKEAHTNFVMANATSAVIGMVDFQAWHLAFLLGSHATDKVATSMTNFLNAANDSTLFTNSTEQQLIKERLFQLCSRVRLLFSSSSPLYAEENSETGQKQVDNDMIRMQHELIYMCLPSAKLQVESESTAEQPLKIDEYSSEEVYVHWFRCFHGLESISSCAQYLGNYLEYQTHVPQHIYDYRQRWIVWRMLASLLDTLPVYLSDTDPFEIHHPIGQFIPEIVYANQLYANINHRDDIERRRRLHDKWNAKHGSDRFGGDGKQGSSAWIKAFSTERRWWLETLLSANQLGDFSEGLIEYDMKDVLPVLDSARRKREKDAKAQVHGSERDDGDMNDDDDISKHSDEDDAGIDLSSFEAWAPPAVYSEAFKHPVEYWEDLRGAMSRLVTLPSGGLDDNGHESMLYTSYFQSQGNGDDDVDGILDPLVDFPALPEVQSTLKALDSATNSSQDWLPFGTQFYWRSNDSEDIFRELYAISLRNHGGDHERLSLPLRLPIPTQGDVQESEESSMAMTENCLDDATVEELIADFGRQSELRRLPHDILAMYYEMLRESSGSPLHSFSMATMILDPALRPAHALWITSLSVTGQPTFRMAQIPPPLLDTSMDKDGEDKAGPDDAKTQRPLHYYNTKKNASASQRLHQYELMQCYGSGDLELLTFQALVAAHLSDQDNFFTVRVVQILCHHVLRAELVNDNPATAVECLAYLAARNVNVRRCIAKGLEYACRRIPVDQPAPLYYLNGRTGPLQSEEFNENHKDSTQRKKNNSQVDSATQASSEESLVQRRQQRRREEREKMIVAHRDYAHEIELVAGQHTVYDPIQFEPRKVF